MQYIKQRILAWIVLLLGFIAIANGNIKAQNVIRKGNTFVEQKSDSARGGATKTQYLYTDKKGRTDTVYISSTGKAFVWKVSKNGNRYRKYLPKITEQLNKEKK